MNNFSMGALTDWDEVLDGFVLLPGVAETLHEHRFEMVSEQLCNVYAKDELDEPAVLVASGAGRSRVKFVSVGGVTLYFETTGRVFVKRAYRVPQLRRESDVPSFASLEPRVSGPAADLKRMMLAVQINNQRREAALAAEVGRLSARLDSAERAAAKPRTSSTPAAKKPDDVIQDEDAGGVQK